MVRAAHIEDGRVVNIIVVESLEDMPGLIDAGAASVGDVWDGAQFAPAEVLPSSVAEYDAALTEYIDAVARSKRWENRVSLMARAGFPGRWQADAIAFGQWATACETIGYQILADFEAGRIPQPTIAQVIAALPEMVWPEVTNG